VESKTIVFTEGDDDGDVNPDELVVGKKHNTGLKMSIIKFDLSELIKNQQEENIWIYESNIFVTVKDGSEGKTWKSQITKLHPVAVPWDEISTNVGQLTSEQNIDESTGEFNELTKEINRNKKIRTEFTETIQKWISPFNKNKNQDYYGVALVSHYTDGSDEREDAKDVRYYSFTNDTEVEEDFLPWIDVCYKKVEIKECNDDYGKVVTNVVSSVVLVKDGDETLTQTNETLTHGKDNDGKKYRTVLKFDLEQFSEKFKTYQIDESFVHLNYLGPSNEDSPTQRTVSVYKITSPWTEDDVTWENLEFDEDKPYGTLIIEKSRLGGTEVTIPIHELARDWIEEGGVDNYGIVLIDDAEDDQGSTPQYAHDDTEPYHYAPEMSICQKTIVSTTPTQIITTTMPVTDRIATQTTPMVVYEPACESKVKEPIEKMKVWVVNDTVVVDPDDYDPEDRTLCVSTNEIAIKFCWDIKGKCKKMQRRDIFGKIETECKCCLPKLKTVETETFDCFVDNKNPIKRTIPIEKIQSCNCMMCARDAETGDSNGMEKVEENLIIDQDGRAATMLLL